MKTELFLQLLKDSSLDLLHFAGKLQQQYSNIELETADGPGRWNTIQVLEHLNSYYRYYLPLIDQKLASSTTTAQAAYRPGWLGNYFTKSMLPKQGVVRNKMKAMKNHSPQPNQDPAKVQQEFLGWQRKLIELLDRAAGKDLEQIRITISIMRLVKLKLGDTFSFIIAHNERHQLQIEKLLQLPHSSFKLETGLVSAALID